MHTAERRATAGLWSIQGVGPVTLGLIRKTVGSNAGYERGSLRALLEEPVERWAPLVDMRADILEHVLAAGTLAEAADRLERRCKAQGVRILFADDPAFPYRLRDIPDAPPMIFAFGPAADAAPRRRIAIVGSRRVDATLVRRLEEISFEAAAAGLCVVSGAATGCDQAAHRGALAAEGETWAFLGSALDEIDLGQQAITRAILDAGGSVFSEFPPGFRANKNSFKVRNRLISGASDAVLVFRAPIRSGALHTADYAVEQGRPLLATPGDPWSEVAEGSNELLREGALTHVDLNDLLKAVGLADEVAKPTPIPFDRSGLGPLAQRVLTQLELGSTDFEGLLSALPGPSSGELSAALVELEVFGAVIHKGGRRYEKR